MSRVQNIVEQSPAWFNWLAIVGSAMLSFLQPIASLVAIIWGGLQIYGWFEKRSKRR